MIDILLEIIITDISWPKYVPEKGSTDNVSAVFDKTGISRNMKMVSYQIRECNSEKAYKTYINPFEETIMMNKIMIYRKDGVYSMKIEFYGMPPKYIGVYCPHRDSKYYYDGSFNADEEEAAKKPLLLEKTTMAFEEVFIYLRSIAKEYKISGEVITQDFTNEYYKVIKAEDLLLSVGNYLISK